MANYSKIIDGERWYWYGWSSELGQALDSKDKLNSKGKLVKIEHGKAGRHGVYKSGKDSNVMGYHTYYR